MTVPTASAAPSTTATALASTSSETNKKVAGSDPKFEGQQKTQHAVAPALQSAAVGGATASAAAVSTYRPLKERRVAVVSFVTQDGLGDLSAGFKFLELLRDHIDIPQEKLFLFTNTSEQNVARFNHEKWNVELFDASKMLETLKPRVDQLNIQFLLVGPTSDNFIAMKGWRVPKALILEYGYDESGNAMGLANTDLGIMIDPSLKSAKKANQAAKPTDPRLFVCHARDASKIVQFTMGIVSNVYSVEKASCRINFIFTQKFRPMQLKRLNEFMKEAAESVRYISLDEFEKENKAAATNPLQTGGRVVTIVTSQVIPNAKLKEFFKQANGALVTGDQSTSEAISAATPFIYECVNHKTEFFNSLKNLLQKHSPVLAEAFSEAVQNCSNANVAKFFAKCNGSEKSKWNNFINDIHTNYDLRTRFRGHLEARLKDDPLVGSKFATYAEMDPKVFQGQLKDLPFDEEVIITLDQLGQLRVLNDTNKSDTGKYPDSLFQSFFIDDNYRLIKRTKDPKYAP
jgi:hypothetical protein